MTREEAIETLEEMIKWGDPYEVNYDACKIAIEALKQEPKTAHWINRHIIANRSFDMIVCSECGEEFSYDAETGISEYNYCPNCGARMESEDKE
jgi:Zn finger protein HypA/HybF involved in hydrogenase expression